MTNHNTSPVENCGKKQKIPWRVEQKNSPCPRLGLTRAALRTPPNPSTMRIGCCDDKLIFLLLNPSGNFPSLWRSAFLVHYPYQLSHIAPNHRPTSWKLSATIEPEPPPKRPQSYASPATVMSQSSQNDRKLLVPDACMCPIGAIRF
jgi:hypothetical protein